MGAIFTVLVFTVPPLLIFGWLAKWLWEKSRQPDNTATAKIFLGILMTCCGLIALGATLCGAIILFNGIGG